MSEGARGITAIEMFLGVTVLAILVGISMPNILRALDGYRSRSGAWELAGNIRLARQKAVSTQREHRVRFTPENASGGPNSYVIERAPGWVQDLPAGANPFVLPGGVKIKASSTPTSGTIAFDSRGNLMGGATESRVNLESAGGAAYQIYTDAVGRVQICRGGCP